MAATGARPLAVTNCLNFGSPDDPAVMWQFTEAVRGLADGCLALGIPVTGGNVSFYNQTARARRSSRRRSSASSACTTTCAGGCRSASAGRAAACCCSAETEAEFGGSLWAMLAHGHLGGRPPAVDLDAERALAAVLVAGAARGLLAAAHDLSDGGLAIALAECCLAGGPGLHRRAARPSASSTCLFSESAARAVVAVRPEPRPSSPRSARTRGAGRRARRDGRRRPRGRRPVRDPAGRTALPRIAATLPALFG